MWQDDTETFLGRLYQHWENGRAQKCINYVGFIWRWTEQLHYKLRTGQNMLRNNEILKIYSSSVNCENYWTNCSIICVNLCRYSLFSNNIWIKIQFFKKDFNSSSYVKQQRLNALFSIQNCTV